MFCHVYIMSMSYFFMDRVRLYSFSTRMDWFKELVIVASNDLNEETLYSLAQQVSVTINAYIENHVNNFKTK